MGMYIPSIGDKLRLLCDWSFPVFFESRNATLLDRLRPGISFGWNEAGSSVMATLPEGSVLRVDRIYVRKGKGAWDSVTFWVVSAPGDEKREKAGRGVSRWARSSEKLDVPRFDAEKVAKLKGARFWAKLADVNELEFERVE